MLISLVGLSHKTAPMEVREKVHLSPEQIPGALRALREVAPEALILSTCNRFEILLRHEHEADIPTVAKVIADQCGVSREVFESALYQHRGADALRHVFRVASSLDSMVIGESQILGQLKHAFALAKQEESVQGALHSILDRAITVAKKIRTETSIAVKPVSMSSVAVDLASKIFGELSGKTALVIGAGKMIVLSIRHLQSHGVKNMLIANRTFQKAAEIATQVGGTAVPFETLADHLSQSDIVISSTGSSDFILRKDQVARAMALRRNRPMLLVDIAMPRDIDPQVHEIGNVYLYAIDNLKALTERNQQERREEAREAEEIVAREAQICWSKLKELDAAPAIQELQGKAEELRRREVESGLLQLGDVSEEQKLGIETLAARLVDKILQGYFCEMRQLAAQPDG
ncbi:MAG TPA: glutamyl-tRNA reductase, partial [Acidobacteriota bacterium]|nr:glutamyl-tRNA reductase [Acidobacteriota bacterium]